ncbi:MAG TPA: hypothetical protein VIG30_05025, partial [Ktedonobacterales bacterium]
ERLQQLIERMKHLPLDDRGRLAAALPQLLEQPAVMSDVVRPEIIAAFEHVLKGSTAVLDYLRDR